MAAAPDLPALKAAADAAGAAFDEACRPHYCDGRWGYYRAMECGHDVPPELHARCDEYLKATHAFYLARDGELGFLGSRGA